MHNERGQYAQWEGWEEEPMKKTSDSEDHHRGERQGCLSSLHIDHGDIDEREGGEWARRPVTRKE
jgi:hypothetical protein